jgi:hypothetical protein
MTVTPPHPFTNMTPFYTLLLTWHVARVATSVPLVLMLGPRGNGHAAAYVFVTLCGDCLWSAACCLLKTAGQVCIIVGGRPLPCVWCSCMHVVACMSCLVCMS